MSGPARPRSRLAIAIIAAALPNTVLAATTCTVSPPSMSLGTYLGDTNTPADSIGTVIARCTRDGGPQNVSITLSLGPSSTSASINNRRLRHAAGTDQLDYNLYRDPLRQNVWGEAIGVNTMTQTVSIPNKATVNVTFNLYGRIPGLQSVYTGSYSDSLLVTVSY